METLSTGSKLVLPIATVEEKPEEHKTLEELKIEYEEKKQKREMRAARFGTLTKEQEALKKRERALKFGTTPKAFVTEGEKLKRKIRKERFLGNMHDKRAERMKRFK